MSDKEIEIYTIKQFLEDIPPGKHVFIEEVFDRSTLDDWIDTPDIKLYCDHETCQGNRFFSSITKDKNIRTSKTNDIFLTYECKNCNFRLKTYAISLTKLKNSSYWTVFKFGEKPSFGPPIPARVFKLIGKDRDLFLLGRRNENQGMGIGAFVYYRRVIENQKNSIFTELIKAVKTISPDNKIIQDLEAAKKEVQFSSAIESIHHALPESLFIQGYNPLKLLHSALSEGIHELSDEQCLKLASSIRVILIELSERLAQILKDKAELNSAVDMLANRKLIED